MSQIRIAIVANHHALAEALATQLSMEGDLAASVARIDEVAARGDPSPLDVLILDHAIVDADAIALTEALRARRPELRIVVVTDDNNMDTAAAAIEAGASAVLSQRVTSAELGAAVRAVHRGETILAPHLLTEVLRRLKANRRPPSDTEARLGTLTAREASVLELLVEGFDRARIARELFVSPNTVRTHIQRILTKLGVHSSLEAVALAIDAGLRPRAGVPSSS
jgi:DNA-binding NarL/FixJ family response regulator